MPNNPKNLCISDSIIDTTYYSEYCVLERAETMAAQITRGNMGNSSFFKKYPIEKGIKNTVIDNEFLTIKNQ